MHEIKKSSGVMKLAMVQMRTVENQRDNLAKSLEAMDTAAAQGADRNAIRWKITKRTGMTGTGA